MSQDPLPTIGYPKEGTVMSNTTTTVPLLEHMTDIQELRNLYHAEMLKTHDNLQLITKLRDDINRHNQVNRDRRQEHESDIQIIGDALLYEADQRSWCDDYDKFVAGLNNQLKVPLPMRESEWSVTLTYSVTVTRNFMATSREDAIEKMESEFDLTDHMHMDNDYNFDVNLEESDAEDA
jgi:hypothetical protein